MVIDSSEIGKDRFGLYVSRIYSGADVDTMILAVAATQMELSPFLAVMGDDDGRWKSLISGMGPVETAVRLGRFLYDNVSQIKGIVQFGVGGAYIQPDERHQVPMLAVCLAEREVFGDLGVTFQDDIEYFPEGLAGKTLFSLDNDLLKKSCKVLEANTIECFSGTFVTVNSVSGTASRGEFLRRRWDGLCENMEGGTAARLCNELNIPLVELRVISNYVEDRNVQNWQLHEACARAGKLGALLVKELI